jgi:hypothetical protein
MLHFLHQSGFGIFFVLGVLNWLFTTDEAASKSRAAEEEEDDEWFAHPMNKDGMNYKK